MEDQFVTLGRQVELGDLYQYSSDSIINCNMSPCKKKTHLIIEIEAKLILNFIFSGLRMYDLVQESSIPLPESSICSYYFTYKEESKWLHLGINSHQKSFITTSRSQPNAREMWFFDYLDYRPSDDCAFVVLHISLRGYRKTITNTKKLLSNVVQRINVTHLVSDVVYGSNCLVILERPIDNPRNRQLIEENLFLTAKSLSVDEDIAPDDLSSINCRFYSNLPGVPLLLGSLKSCLTEMRQILSRMTNPNHQIPVSATITPVPFSPRFSSRDCQYSTDTILISNMLNDVISTCREECHLLLQGPLVERLGRMKTYLEYYLHRLADLSDKVQSIMSHDSGSYDRYDHLKYLWQTYCASGALTEWIIRRKRGFRIIETLFEGINLPFLDLASVTKKADSNARPAPHKKKIFMLKTRKEFDKLFEQFCHDFDNATSPEWSHMEIVSSTADHIEAVRSDLVEFATEVDDVEQFQRYITTSNSDEDATIQIIVESAQPDCSPTHSSGDENMEVGGRDTQLLVQGNPSIFLLRPDEIRIDSNNFRWYEMGVKPSDSVTKDRTLLLMGPSGSGKSAVVENLINYIFGVQWSDSYRLRMATDLETSAVASYTFYEGTMNIPFTLTVIDTPGYCGEVFIDGSSSSLISTFLAHGNSRRFFQTVDVVGLVANANQKLMSPGLKGALEAVPNIFKGQDIPNVAWFCTHSNDIDKSPLVLESIDPASPFRADIYFELDNSTLFASNVEEDDKEEEEREVACPMKLWENNWINFDSLLQQLQDMEEIVEQKPLDIRHGTVSNEWNPEQIRLHSDLDEIDLDIGVSLSRLEIFFKRKPALMQSDKLMRLEVTDPDRSVLDNCINLIRLLDAAATLCHTLKLSGLNSTKIRNMNFEAFMPKAADYIRSIQAKTCRSPIRLKILDLLITLSDVTENQFA